MKLKILLVEDDPGLALTLIDRLEAEGYEILNVDNGNVAAKKAIDDNFSLIILDIMLKGKSGFEVCDEIRSRGVRTPILMLTARSQTSDIITGLKLGADDYLTKPFEVAELLARIEALLRRANLSTSSIDSIKFGDVEVNLKGVEVRRNGEKIDLSSKEFQLLKYLIINSGRLISREEILNEVWGYEENPTTRTVDTHIVWLRQKLEENPKSPKFIVTVHGFGYKFMK